MSNATPHTDAYTFTLSAFGDEIADDLATQLDVLHAEDVHFLELRGAWGTNVLDLDAEQLKRARQLLDERGFGVSAIASPIGKSQIDQPRIRVVMFTWDGRWALVLTALTSVTGCQLRMSAQRLLSSGDALHGRKARAALRLLRLSI